MKTEKKIGFAGICLAMLLIMVNNVNISMVDVAQDSHDKHVGEIYGPRVVGQTFISRQANLNTVAVFLATSLRENTKDVIFRLRSSPESSVDIVTIVVNARVIRDNQYYEFKFDPIEGSKGKAYYFSIESPDSRPGDAITVWYSSQNRYDEGSAYVDHAQIDGDLRFKTYYQTKLSKVLENFCGRVLRDIYFFSVYLLIIMVLIAMLVRGNLAGVLGNK